MHQQGSPSAPKYGKGGAGGGGKSWCVYLGRGKAKRLQVYYLKEPQTNNMKMRDSIFSIVEIMLNLLKYQSTLKKVLCNSF